MWAAAARADVLLVQVVIPYRLLLAAARLAALAVVTSTLVGHLDYSFASAWHPDGRTFATGNQDKTCRVWDLRNLSTSLSVLRGNIGAIRCIRYSSDGQFMLFSEPADFVHVYSAAADYKMSHWNVSACSSAFVHV
ncbi:hypothetical protein GUJ93_ZPchr0006g42683 [Zizania palustris]|uniref:Uncharacterized protein n=1 Tax=Zizania palustris TaxID=103762 RepID=A0A8J5SNY8_ZIZPA|nr:hypothetical protein GUJ93_ZPchr0006g42683 [Zizania palustris]